MAEERIEGKELIEPGLYDQFIKDSNNALATLKQVHQAFNDFLNLTKEQSKQFSQPNSMPKQWDEQAEALHRASEAAKTNVAIKKQIIATEEKIAAVTNGSTAELEKLKLQYAESNKEAKELAKAELGLTNEYDKKSKLLNDLRKKYKDLAAQGKENEKAAIALKNQIIPLDKELKKIDATIGQHQRNVGGYKEALESLPGPLGEFAKGIGIAYLATKTLEGAKYIFKTFFEGSQQGADKLAQTWAGISAGFMVLKKDIIDTGNELVDNLDKADKSSGHWYNTLLAGVTAFFKSGGDIGKMASEFGILKSSMDDASNTMIDYTKASQELAKLENSMIVPRAQANLAIKKARELTYDETLSIEEKIKAVKQAVAIEDEQTAKEIEHQKKVVELTQSAYDLKKRLNQASREDEKQLEQAKAKTIDLETESITRKLRAERELFSLEKELRTQREAAQKEENEREKKAYETQEQENIRRKKDAEDTSKGVEKAYDEYYENKKDAFRLTAIGVKKWTENLQHDLLIIEREKLEAELKDENISAEDKIAIRKKLSENTIALKQNEFDTLERKEKEAAEKREKQEKSIYDAASKLSDDYYTREEKAIDRSISNAQRRQQTLALLAQQGVDNAAASLAQEQKNEAEAERKKAELEKQKQHTEFALTVLKLETANLEANPNNPAKATIETTEQVAALIAVINGLPSFFEGIEDTGNGGKLDANGGHLAVLHRKERVMDAENNAKTGYMPNDELANIASMYNAGMLIPIAQQPRYLSTRTDELVNEVRQVKEAIKSLDMPNTEFYYDTISESFVKRVETKTKIERDHFKQHGGIW